MLQGNVYCSSFGLLVLNVKIHACFKLFTLFCYTLCLCLNRWVDKATIRKFAKESPNVLFDTRMRLVNEVGDEENVTNELAAASYHTGAGCKLVLFVN